MLRSANSLKGGNQLIKFYNKLEETLLALSLIIMVALNFFNVVSRYFIHASISFTEEVLIMLLIWNTMLASALAFKHKAHLGLSVLTDLFPQKFQKYFVIISTAASIFLMGSLFRFGIKMLSNQFKYNIKTPVLGMPESVISIAIPLGAIIILLRVIEAAVSAIKELKEGEE